MLDLLLKILSSDRMIHGIGLFVVIFIIIMLIYFTYRKFVLTNKSSYVPLRDRPNKQPIYLCEYQDAIRTQAKQIDYLKERLNIQEQKQQTISKDTSSLAKVPFAITPTTNEIIDLSQQRQSKKYDEKPCSEITICHISGSPEQIEKIAQTFQTTPTISAINMNETETKNNTETKKETLEQNK